MQNLRQRFDHISSSRVRLAAAMCLAGGGIVLLLSFVGGITGETFLVRSTYDWRSFVFYLFVVPLGWAIWRELHPYALHVALGVVVLEFAIGALIELGSSGTFPDWLIVLKGVILILTGQAVTEVNQGGGQPPYQGPPGGPPQGGWGGGPPQGGYGPPQGGYGPPPGHGPGPGPQGRY